MHVDTESLSFDQTIHTWERKSKIRPSNTVWMRVLDQRRAFVDETNPVPVFKMACRNDSLFNIRTKTSPSLSRWNRRCKFCRSLSAYVNTGSSAGRACPTWLVPWSCNAQTSFTAKAVLICSEDVHCIISVSMAKIALVGATEPTWTQGRKIFPSKDKALKETEDFQQRIQ